MEGQKRMTSLVESLLNVVIGYAVAVAAQTMIFPLFGIFVSLGENIIIAGLFTVISVIRSFSLRRLFNYLQISGGK